MPRVCVYCVIPVAGNICFTPRSSNGKDMTVNRRVVDSIRILVKAQGRTGAIKNNSELNKPV